MNAQLMDPKPHSPQPLPPVRVESEPARLTAQQVLICLSVCVALQMISFVMIVPLFARRFEELGAGVDSLSLSAMAYALTATAAAPFMGALSDRIGRRPVVLGSLAVYVLAFTGYLFAHSATAFILLRAVAGALTAGMMPAAASMVADLAPADRRARWIGIMGGGASIGWIAGPALGGMLYDRWGYSAALLAAIGLSAVAFATALTTMRETRRPVSRPLADTEPQSMARKPTNRHQWFPELRAALPARPVPLAVVLLTYFGVMFAWAFIEPRFMFYAYDDLGWSSSMLGLVMSTYGIAMMLGEFGLSRLSDDLGRKPVILAGLLLFSAQFIGLALTRNYILLAIAFVLAGLGNALYDPALSAWILDLVPSSHQARVLGLKSTAGSIGNIVGPGLVVLFTSRLSAQDVFLVSTGIVLLITVTAAVADRGVIRGKRTGDHGNSTGQGFGSFQAGVSPLIDTVPSDQSHRKPDF